MKYAWLLALVMSCTSAHVPPQTSVQKARSRIVKDRLAWSNDTIPIVRFDPPNGYRQLRRMVEECSGKKRDGWPLLFIAPVNPLGWNERGFPVLAVTYPQQGATVFALGMEREQFVVAHEMLHWIYWPEVTRDHPASVFGPDAPCAYLLKTPEG